MKPSLPGREPLGGSLAKGACAMRPCSAVPVAWVQRGPFLARLSPVPGGGGRCVGARVPTLRPRTRVAQTVARQMHLGRSFGAGGAGQGGSLRKAAQLAAPAASCFNKYPAKNVSVITKKAS